MDNAPQGMRHCPTRADRDALFAHVITKETCQTRQRQHYHKCSTCEHLNDRAAAIKPVPKKEAV
jgi:hypothetical protein